MPCRRWQRWRRAGRQALDELRHLLGVLRPETEVDGLGPQPGLSDVPRLVDQLREAGLEVSLTIDGAHVDLPARVDLSAYRIVQEALTNVLKHAGPSARTEVRLSTDKRGVAIKVLDNGHGATILPGSGTGSSACANGQRCWVEASTQVRVPVGVFGSLPICL